jgi:hypothetical protein
MRGLTSRLVSIEAVQDLESRFENVEFLGRAGAFCIRFLRLSGNGVDNTVFETDYNFRAEDGRELFKKALFDAEHAEYVNEGLPCDLRKWLAQDQRQRLVSHRSGESLGIAGAQRTVNVNVR